MLDQLKKSVGYSKYNDLLKEKFPDAKMFVLFQDSKELHGTEIRYNGTRYPYYEKTPKEAYEKFVELMNNPAARISYIG